MGYKVSSLIKSKAYDYGMGYSARRNESKIYNSFIYADKT